MPARSCQKLKRLGGSWRSCSSRRSGRTEGEGRGAAAAEFEWMVVSASCASSQNIIILTLVV